MSNTLQLRRLGSGPAEDLVPITPSDSTTFTSPYRGFYVQTAGTLKIVTNNGEERTFPSGLFSTGVFHAVPFRKVFATGTSAVIWGVK